MNRINNQDNNGCFFVRGIKVRIDPAGGCAIYSKDIGQVKRVRRYLELEGFLDRDKNLVEV